MNHEFEKRQTRGRRARAGETAAPRGLFVSLNLTEDDREKIGSKNRRPEPGQLPDSGTKLGREVREASSFSLPSPPWLGIRQGKSERPQNALTKLEGFIRESEHIMRSQ